MKNLYTLGVNACRRLVCLVIMCMSVFSTLKAQQTPKQLSLPDVPICGGYYEYLPEGYDPAGSKTYPLLLFIHGMGEEGDGSMAQLPAVLRHGPPKLISQNTWPKTFTVNGQTFSFIVISPQFKGPAHADQLHALINYLKKTYKIDPSRVYLTGISRGGGVIWAYTSYKDEYAKNIAAIVDICGAYTPNTVLPQVLARNNLPVWGINNEGDPTVPWEWTADWVKYINAYVPTPNPKAKATIFPGGGHDAWTKVYNPTYTEDGMNIYQWMLQYQRGSTPPPPPPPGNKRIVVNATAPNIIYYPDAMKTLGAKPGDTLCIPAGNYQSIYFANVTGTAEKPVVITNCGGQVKVGVNNPGTNVVFDMASCTFFELSGSGTPGVQYGFDINGTNTAGTRIFGMYLVNGCSDFDLHHIYFHDASTFLVAKTQQYCSNPQYWDGQYTMKNVKFHDILARNAQWEGFYIGNTKYIMNTGCGDMPSHRISGIWMYNMDIANTGSDGIQVSLADKGDNRIFNVRLDNYATEKISAHGYGLLIGGGSAMRVYNNHISRGYGPGVAVFGGGISYVYNNLITDMTYEAINIADKPLDGFETVTAYVYNNTIDRVGLDGITSYASNTTLGHKVFNNLIICVGTPYDYPSPGLYLKGPAPMKLEASNNLHYKTAAEAGFVNAEANDYHLLSTSKAIDAGRDMSDMQLTTDRDGAARPVNAKFDIGAFEFRGGATNIPPTANAGQDITITLPTTSATLDASASKDNDGAIAAYAWRKVTGPAEGATTIAATAKPAITGLVVGTYVFELTVTDDKGATATDNVTVIVKAANLPPTANAGANITIRQPANTAALDGSASKDTDGTITYSWRKVSNPAGATGDAIATPTAAKTNLTGLNTVGDYVYELTVTDNNNATATARVTVTVLAAANVPPVANAGANINIRQPVSTANLDGTASSDPDGNIATWAWRKVSNPAGATGDAIATASASKTDVTGLNTVGDYVYELTVTDNGGAQHSARVTVTVLAAEQNVPPVANAGTNVTIQLPVSTASLDGSASHDEDGEIVTYAWRKISNPTGATGDAIASPNADKTNITGLNTAGIYSYELTVKDDKGDQNSAVVTITVLAAHQNVPPVADAGTNISIQLPENDASLSGLGSRDEDGTITAWAWRKVSSPAGAAGDAITTPNAAETNVTGLNTAGNYVYELKVTDNNGAVSTAQVTVTVAPRPNIPPQISIGENITITLPTSSATLDASASHDEDGTIATWSWRKLSGPTSGGNLASTTASRTDVTGFTEAGTYVYELTITDNNGATATAQISVIVKPAPGPVNQAPVARIDGDKTIKLPLDFVFLDSRNSTDTDGQITGYLWRQLSGPSQADNSRPDKSQTRFSGLIEGEYVFELTVTDDDGATGTATFKVTVEKNDMDTDGKVTLYPVPAKTFVRVMIDNPGTGSMRISIYDMNGRIKKTITETVNQVHTYQKEIVLDDIMTGNYLLEVMINGSKCVKQFIKVQ